MSYINAMYGLEWQRYIELSIQICSWCIESNIWLSATHNLRPENVADYSSQHFHVNVEWILDRSLFQRIIKYWTPLQNVFASRRIHILETTSRRIVCECFFFQMIVMIVITYIVIVSTIFCYFQVVPESTKREQRAFW